MTCDLCKREFDEVQARFACSSCSLVRGCTGVRCPYCYYEAVAEPIWLQKLRSIFSSKQNVENLTRLFVVEEEIIPLTSLKANQEAWIKHLDMKSRQKLEELIAMGVLPGREIKVIQRFPSFVFQVGFSQFSVDRELASCIHVKPNRVDGKNVWLRGR